MRRTLFSSFILTSVSFCLLAGGAALAQTPGGGQSPTMPQSSPTRPGAAGNPNSPNNPNNPMGRTPDNNPDAMTTRVNDKKFVKDAAIGGLTEVELGKLAAQKGSSDAVKQFGQKLVDDHTKANDELKQIASSENIQVPDTLDSKHQSRIDKLSAAVRSKFRQSLSEGPGKGSREGCAGVSERGARRLGSKRQAVCIQDTAGFAAALEHGERSKQDG